ncbi:MAG: EAL domain-containing protein, partial [Bradyrhizobium sp.]|nr:EAL domain-containing protein [Bradyrhizobium sp.]
ISLNVGRTEIEDGKFLAVLRHECSENAIPLSLIKVELSENGVSTAAILEEFCEELKSAGVKISIDDFGVQNSNLARLSNLKYDEIKVDKSLVDGISEHYKQDILVIFSDALAKLLARDEPNRGYYKQLFSTDANNAGAYELLTRTFALAISPLPDKTKEQNRNPALPSLIETRKPFLMQGLLSAEILASLAPGPEAGVARSWRPWRPCVKNMASG